MYRKPITVLLLTILTISITRGQEILEGPLEVILSDGLGAGVSMGSRHTISNADFSLTVGDSLSTNSWGAINFGYLNEVTGSI